MRSPMEWVRQPKTPQKLIPIIRDEDTAKVLTTCAGKGFAGLRDEAIIRLLYNTGAQLSEVAGFQLGGVDLATDSVCYHGKGGKDRWVRFGPKTGRAVSRYLRAARSTRVPDWPICGWPSVAPVDWPPTAYVALIAVIWHDRATGQPRTRFLIAYDH